MNTFLTRLCAALLLCAGTAANAAGAHVHGKARLDIAVEATRFTVQLDSPLDNILGFERAPRTDAERKQAAAAVAKLTAAESMFKIDPAAQCKLANVVLTSAALKLGKPDAAAPGHAEIEGSFEFKCTDAANATYVDVGLFEFAHLQGLQVQVASPRGQFKRDLKRPASRIVLTK